MNAGLRSAACRPGDVGDAFVHLRGVSLSYDDDAEALALDCVDLQVGKGEFAAVGGPSGCGKSTLLKLAAGLLPPRAGTVLVGGEAGARPPQGGGLALPNPD